MSSQIHQICLYFYGKVPSTIYLWFSLVCKQLSVAPGRCCKTAGTGQGPSLRGNLACCLWVSCWVWTVIKNHNVHVCARPCNCSRYRACEMQGLALTWTIYFIDRLLIILATTPWYKSCAFLQQKRVHQFTFQSLFVREQRQPWQTCLYILISIKEQNRTVMNLFTFWSP